MSIVLEQCKSFIKIGILPELIGKYYLREPVVNHPDQENIAETEQDELWRYCRQPEGDQQMIACDDNTCRIQWFYVSCLSIKKIPKCKWFYQDCRKLISKAKKNVSNFFIYYSLLFAVKIVSIQWHN